MALYSIDDNQFTIDSSVDFQSGHKEKDKSMTPLIPHGGIERRAICEIFPYRETPP